MAAATVSPTEDQVFDAVWAWLAAVFDLPDTTDQIVKGYQNLVAVPPGTYVVVSPGIMERQDFSRNRYDPATETVTEEAHSTYSYQVDCYGADGPNWASIIAVAWRTMWGVDAMGASPVFTPLYADAPQQLNIVNSEGQFEQRFMVKLFGQVNQIVSLPQQFFSDLELNSIIAADQL